MNYKKKFMYFFLILSCFELRAATNEELSQRMDEIEKRQEEIFLLSVENSSPVKSYLNDNLRFGGFFEPAITGLMGPPNGSAVRFIDRQANSEERKKFLRQVIRKSNSEVDIFWIGQKLYTGSSAPLQVNSDQMMTSVVASFSGAIGYVSDNFLISDKVKKVEVSN